MPGSLIVAGARTPVGRLSGALASLSAVELAGVAIRAALERAGVGGGDVDRIYMGHVIQAGQGQQNARAAAARGGIPLTAPSTTVNKVCLSGLNSLFLADRMIQSGFADVVVARGMESMQTPWRVRSCESTTSISSRSMKRSRPSR